MTTKLRQSVKLYSLSLCLARYSKAAFSSAGLAVAGSDAGEGDGLAHDVVRGEQEIRQAPASQALEDLPDPRVVAVIRREEREEEARIDEDHLRP